MNVIVAFITAVLFVLMFAMKFPPDSKVVPIVALLAVGYAGFSLARKLK